jgi:hypothetical protein
MNSEGFDNNHLIGYLLSNFYKNSVLKIELKLKFEINNHISL